MSDFARVTHDVVAAIEEQPSHCSTDSLRGSRHNDGLLFRSHTSLPPSPLAVAPRGSNHPAVTRHCEAAHCYLLDGKLWNLISKNGRVTFHGEPRRHPDIHQSGSVREHQPGSPLVGYADLDGEPAAFGAGVEPRRVAPETHDATGDPDCPGT